MTGVFTDVIAWYMDNMNYFTITLLMAIESSFIPLPSELVVPPAAYKAAQGELNIYLVVIFATIGALIGALFNYTLAYFVGRAAIYKLANTRLARLFLIEPKSIQKSEDYFIKNGNISTLIGRLVPVIRHLISIPAGLAKMPLRSFIIYTTIGAFIWNICLALMGYFIPKELIENYYHELTIGGLALGFLFVAYLVYKGFKNKAPSQ
jgi:membrane protein DedA with SNARE-associated domain